MSSPSECVSERRFQWRRGWMTGGKNNEVGCIGIIEFLTIHWQS